MRRIVNVLLAMLLFWFTLDITGFALGKFNLVESPGIKSVDAVWWVLFILCAALFLWKERVGKYILSIFLTAWALIQYSSHWHYTLFGATERKLRGYNHFFGNTYHIIPASDSVLIPDLYHIVLHILILALLIMMIVGMFQNRNKT